MHAGEIVYFEPMLSVAFLMSDKVKGKTWCMDLKVGQGRLCQHWSALPYRQCFNTVKVQGTTKRAPIVPHLVPLRMAVACCRMRGPCVLPVHVPTAQPSNGRLNQRGVPWSCGSTPSRAGVTLICPLPGAQNNPKYMSVARVIPTKLCVSNKGGKVQIEYNTFKR